MLEQHQDSLLPAVRQGEEGHETAAKRPYLVRINCVLNAFDIHIPDPYIALRNTVPGRKQGGRCVHGLRIR